MAINPTISDMKWLGEPVDLVGNFQKGRNLAEQSQRMKQSADMHPLKMADMKSATAARDANTNLSKQSYRFNELTEADRVSNVKSLARRNEVAANIAENTQIAEQNMINLRALNAQRDYDVREGIDVALERQGKIAEIDRVITNQAINKATEQDQIKNYKHRTNLLSHQAYQSSLVSQFKQLTQGNAIKAQNAQLEALTTQAEHTSYNLLQEERGRQPLEESMLTVSALANAGDHAAVSRMLPPEGITDSQRQRWFDHRDAVMNNKAGTDYKNAVKASTANQVQTITGAQEYSGKIAEMGLGTIDANGVLQIDPKNLERVKRYTEQRKLLDQMKGSETEALMEALGAINEMDVFGAPAGGLGGGQALLDPSKGMSLQGMASMHGTRHGDDILLSDQGLRRLKNIVNKRNKEVAFADDNRRLQAQLTQLQALGQSVKEATIKDGKVELTTASGRMTSDQRQAAVRQMYETLAKAANDAGHDFTQAQLMSEARRQVFASDIPSASTAAELRGLGIREGGVYWNPIAKNDDGTVGGVRVAGEPDVNTGHNVLGPLRGANAGNEEAQSGGGQAQGDDSAKPQKFDDPADEEDAMRSSNINEAQANALDEAGVDWRNSNTDGSELMRREIARIDSEISSELRKLNPLKNQLEYGALDAGVDMSFELTPAEKNDLKNRVSSMESGLKKMMLQREKLSRLLGGNKEPMPEENQSLIKSKRNFPDSTPPKPEPLRDSRYQNPAYKDQARIKKLTEELGNLADRRARMFGKMSEDEYNKIVGRIVRLKEEINFLKGNEELRSTPFDKLSAP